MGIIFLACSVAELNAESAARARATSTESDAEVKSGTLLWKHEIGAPMWGPLATEGGILYFGCDDGRVISFDAQTRKNRWEFRTGGLVRSSVAIDAGKAVVASDDGYLYALDATTGKELWRFDLGSAGMKRIPPAAGPPYEYDYLQSSPVLSNGTVYIGSMNNRLYAIGLKSGEERWHYETGGKIRATPVLDHGTVYVGSWDGNLYALNRDAGKLRWRHDTGGIIQGTAAVAGGKVVVGCRRAMILALSASTGDVLWKHVHADGSWVESSPVIDAVVIYIGSSDARKLFAFDLESGQQLWAFETGGWSWATPVVTSGEVYIGGISASPYYMPGVTLRAGFHAVDRETGQLRWSMSPEAIEGYITGGVMSTPALIDQVVIVAGLDGWLYALRR
jgi:outer membrane protein assembly factor BamB